MLDKDIDKIIKMYEQIGDFLDFLKKEKEISKNKE